MTIYKNIPNGFKSEEKRESGRQSHKNIPEQSATESGPEIKVSSTGEQSVNEEERKDPVQIHDTDNIADPRIAELSELNKDLTFDKTRLEMKY